MYEITKNVPIPKADRPVPPAKRVYPFEDMDVGDMFFVPTKGKNNIAIYASRVGRKLGRKFSTRRLHMVELDDGWVPCEPDDMGSVQGIGVWRVE